MTKIAFKSESPATLRAWLESHKNRQDTNGEARLTTRYKPKRFAEMEGGSLYWIHSSTIVGRSPILGFEENGQGRYWIRLKSMLIPVQSVPRRAHQGWRYLTEEDAPPDLSADTEALAEMPPKMLGELTRMGLV